MPTMPTMPNQSVHPIYRRFGFKRSFIFSFCASTLACCLAIACSDDDVAPSNGTTTPPDASLEASSAPDTSPSPSPDASPDALPTAITITTITSFDATKFELPEALSYRDGFAYVSLAPKAEIAKVAIAGGARSLYATLPIQASNFVLGSAFDTAGNLFVGIGATNPGDAPGVAAAGIYKIPPGANGAGGTPVLFASSNTGLKFGNGLAFDSAGNLYVSDAAEGAIYKIPPAGAVGTATVWKTDASLTGDMAACPSTVAGFPIGANGIFVDTDAVWIGNTDRGALVKVAIDNGSGAPGAVTTVVADCANLEGLDGLRPDPKSPSTAFVGTNNPKNTLVRITRTGQVTVLHKASPPDLDGPADLVHVTGTSSPTEFLVVNSAFPEAFAPPDAGLVPKPSLVKITLP